MAPIIPNPKKIKSFSTEAAFETWLAANHGRETELWLKIHKKDSGLLTITCAEALDVVLCWGWIDGIRKGFDERSFLPPSPTTFAPPSKPARWARQTFQTLVAMLARGETIVPERRRFP